MLILKAVETNRDEVDGKENGEEKITDNSQPIETKPNDNDAQPSDNKPDTVTAEPVATEDTDDKISTAADNTETEEDEESEDDVVDGPSAGGESAENKEKHEPETDEPGPQRVPVNDLETINQKRQEELETFQVSEKANYQD